MKTRDSIENALQEGCTLSEQAYAERMAWVRSEILPHAVSREPIPGGWAWEFEDAAALRDKLDRLVELERECCGDVEFAHRPSDTEKRRRLEIRGIDGVRAEALVQSPVSAASGSLGRRFGKAAGIGTLLAMLACCGIPIAAVAIFGAAAAPLAFLESPWVIAPAILLFGAAALVWTRRRAPAVDRGRDCGCG